MKLAKYRLSSGQLGVGRVEGDQHWIRLTGRYDEARARAEAFRKRTPDSLFLPTVESAIASIPSAPGG